MEEKKKTVAAVRAIPQPGHKRRWCGLEKWVEDRANRPHPEQKHGLPWPDTEVKVYVVDEPEPFNPDANGGVPVEISPLTLEALLRDERMAVRIISGNETIADVNEAKAAKAEVESQLLDLAREKATIAEQLTKARISEETAIKTVAANAQKVASLEEENALLRAQLDQAHKPATKKK